jgi:hypothetical protein
VVEEKVAHPAVVGAEPVADGDGEAHLGTVNDVWGKIAPGDLAEEALALAAGHQ